MFSNIPNELKELNQWVLWARVPRGNRDAKVPYSVNGFPARTNDSRTWSSYEATVDAYMTDPERYSGIGFVFTDKDPYCGIDLDHCINGGEIDEWANNILKQLDSYTEYSPSGTGIHILAKGKKPTAKCKKGLFEIYEKGRYFTVTGQQIGSCNEAKDIQSVLNHICIENL